MRPPAERLKFARPDCAVIGIGKIAAVKRLMVFFPGVVTILPEERNAALEEYSSSV
jgi:hypothetical protein